mmetsp:Transcript_104115/g.303987  ORF Transcript_104115/g.303987 Transcript_104115/m.303987 type:complete len:87 (-) Transcript_104115:8-268(-)
MLHLRRCVTTVFRERGRGKPGAPAGMLGLGAEEPVSPGASWQKEWVKPHTSGIACTDLARAGMSDLSFGTLHRHLHGLQWCCKLAK